jgi:peptidoglycan/xylan/chitin deacetylase (PgdA/CDA1 family)
MRPRQARHLTGFLLLLLVAATQASLLLLLRPDARHLLLAAGLYGSGTLVTLFFLFHPRNQCLVANRSRVACPAGRPCVCLTFDDGPHAETTPRLLDLLRQKNVKATFFVVGREAERHPDLVRRLIDEGHTVGNHTYSHPALFCFLTPARLRSEVERTQATLARLIGRPPRLFRSPVGLRHPFLAGVLEDAGVEYISWELRTFDTHPGSATSFRDRILEGVGPGDIVLMHDRPALGTTALFSVLPEVIDRLKDRGYEFGTP